MLEARPEAPLPREQVAAFDRACRARPRALAGDHRVATVVEQLVDGMRTEVCGRDTRREARSHLHPARRWVAVGRDLEHLERVDRTELRSAERARHPHREHAVAVERLDDFGSELSRFVRVGLVSIEQRQHGHRAFGEVGVCVEGRVERHARRLCLPERVSHDPLKETLREICLDVGERRVRQADDRDVPLRAATAASVGSASAGTVVVASAVVAGAASVSPEAAHAGMASPAATATAIAIRRFSGGRRCRASPSSTKNHRPRPLPRARGSSPS